MNTIRPEAPSKIPGCTPFHLSEEADDEIRYHFPFVVGRENLFYGRYSS